MAYEHTIAKQQSNAFLIWKQKKSGNNLSNKIVFYKPKVFINWDLQISYICCSITIDFAVDCWSTRVLFFLIFFFLVRSRKDVDYMFLFFSCLLKRMSFVNSCRLWLCSLFFWIQLLGAIVKHHSSNHRFISKSNHICWSFSIYFMFYGVCLLIFLLFLSKFIKLFCAMANSIWLHLNYSLKIP